MWDSDGELDFVFAGAKAPITGGYVIHGLKAMAIRNGFNVLHTSYVVPLATKKPNL
jgi:hypothetical protein